MAYTCPRCGRTSHHPADEQFRYCEACHRFEDEPTADDVRMVAVHPVLWGELRRWLRSRGLILRRIPRIDLAVWIASPVDAAFDRPPDAHEPCP